ncbi:MAG: hypothetical protein ACQESR_28570 [Planctomycetota bacterium]
MESCPRQPVLPAVGLAADHVIRDRYTTVPRAFPTKKKGGKQHPLWPPRAKRLTAL